MNATKNNAGMAPAPTKTSYDVVIIGGAIMGSSTAWFLMRNPDFKGTVLVVERDPSYEDSSTARTNSCIRQQFSIDLNVRLSQFTAEVIKNFREYMGGDERVPELHIQNFGYMYLANTQGFADILKDNHENQTDEGAGTELLTPEQISERYPFYNVDDIVLGSVNTKDEGYWEGGTVFDWMRRRARELGAEYVANEVVAIDHEAGRVKGVTLSSGETISCGTVVSAAGARASQVAKMVGTDIPVEPRKRLTWVFSADKPLDRELPLTVDPSGVHCRTEGPETYMVGCPADPDIPVAPDDLEMDHDRFENHVWPILAHRIPQFDALRVINSWAGHYAYNRLDQNPIVGRHTEIENFIFLNGFSGRGLQQSPAMGRGVSELIIHGEYRSLDISPFGYGRIVENKPIRESAVI